MRGRLPLLPTGAQHAPAAAGAIPNLLAEFRVEFIKVDFVQKFLNGFCSDPSLEAGTKLRRIPDTRFAEELALLTWFRRR